jgi:hypothetical protein
VEQGTAQALRLLIILIAAVEAAFLGIFAVAAMSGDEWGIARAMFFLLAIPFALSTVPALILAWLGRLRLAALFIALSLPLIWLSWWMA